MRKEDVRWSAKARVVRRRKPLPRSFKDLTPSKHFNPSTFFYEMVWKALLTPRTGEHMRPQLSQIDSRPSGT